MGLFCHSCRAKNWSRCEKRMWRKKARSLKSVHFPFSAALALPQSALCPSCYSIHVSHRDWKKDKEEEKNEKKKRTPFKTPTIREQIACRIALCFALKREC